MGGPKRGKWGPGIGTKDGIAKKPGGKHSSFLLNTWVGDPILMGEIGDAKTESGDYAEEHLE